MTLSRHENQGFSMLAAVLESADRRSAMNVVSVMTPNPACCAATTPLREVARMIARQTTVARFPVVDASQHPIGVVTDRDIAVRVVAEGRNTNEATAADAMSMPVRTVTTETSLADLRLLDGGGPDPPCAGVDAQGKLAGIVSIADLALAGKQEATAEVVKEISGADAALGATSL
jgi:CBS domain-containing protein